jgi:hypothetical protein
LKTRIIETPEKKALGAIFTLVLLCVCCVFFLSSPHGYGPEPDSMTTLEKEKDRTVYIVGLGDREQIKEDTDKALDIHRGVVIDSRGCSGKGSDNNR